MENDIQCQDLLAMRGLNFTVPIAVYEKNVGLAKLIKIDTFEWNPIHFATIYKEFKVLEIEIEVKNPPEPSIIRWENLQVDNTH